MVYCPLDRDCETKATNLKVLMKLTIIEFHDKYHKLPIDCESNRFERTESK